MLIPMDYFDSIPNEIFYILIEYFTRIDVLNIRILNCRFHDAVQQIEWKHYFVTVGTDVIPFRKKITSLLQFYKTIRDPNLKNHFIVNHCHFLNYKFSTDITDNQFIQTLNILNKRKIEIRSIDLSFCSKLTSRSFKLLDNFQMLGLGYCTITDFKHLRNCRALDLHCTEITDDGLQYLNKCERLSLYGCKITGEGFKYLCNCTDLCLRYCKNITDGCLKYLAKCLYLNLWECDQITDVGLAYLKLANY